MVCGVEGPDQDPLDARAEDGGEDHRGDDRQPDGEALLGGEHPHQVGAEHRHVALGEVHQRGRLEDQHEADGDDRVDGAVVQTVEDALIVECIGINQTHQLKQILAAKLNRRCRQQDEIAGGLAQQPANPVVAGRRIPQIVRLIDDDLVEQR